MQSALAQALYGVYQVLDVHFPRILRIYRPPARTAAEIRLSIGPFSSESFLVLFCELW